MSKIRKLANMRDNLIIEARQQEEQAKANAILADLSEEGEPAE